MPVSLILYIISALCFLLLAVGAAVGDLALLNWGLTFLAAGHVSAKTSLG